jgi:hypothetical protein
MNNEGKTERKSLLAMIVGRLSQGAVPVDGVHFWEPAGALKFSSKVQTAASTAKYRACHP